MAKKKQLRQRGSPAARTPEFGQQTDEVLKEFGFGDDEIARLREARVV
ncbi:hypothetical protein [Bradyrhizobium sp. Cp5.3]|nr:hypothetical protein [Bradyrhizobium sp. Cp5.3]